MKQGVRSDFLANSDEGSQAHSYTKKIKEECYTWSKDWNRFIKNHHSNKPKHNVFLNTWNTFI